MDTTQLSNRKRNAAIDFLKFIATLLVLNSHMGLCYPKYSKLATGGAIGDALFFFVSGLTIYQGANLTFLNWFKKRLLGMIFLDYRFTIPNFPSRLLAYMQAGLPILACTDTATDIGQVITEGHFGWWCPSNSTQAFAQTVEEAQNASLSPSAELHFLQEHYSAKVGYDIIQTES